MDGGGGSRPAAKRQKLGSGRWNLFPLNGGYLVTGSAGRSSRVMGSRGASATPGFLPPPSRAFAPSPARRGGLGRGSRTRSAEGAHAPSPACRGGLGRGSRREAPSELASRHRSPGRSTATSCTGTVRQRPLHPSPALPSIRRGGGQKPCKASPATSPSHFNPLTAPEAGRRFRVRSHTTSWVSSGGRPQAVVRRGLGGRPRGGTTTATRHDDWRGDSADAAGLGPARAHPRRRRQPASPDPSAGTDRSRP
jgi:hypothetical protein